MSEIRAKFYSKPVGKKVPAMGGVTGATAYVADLGLIQVKAPFRTCPSLCAGYNHPSPAAPRTPAGAFQIRHSTPNMRRASAPCLD
jgi:hypothetical protein